MTILESLNEIIQLHDAYAAVRYDDHNDVEDNQSYQFNHVDKLYCLPHEVINIRSKTPDLAAMRSDSVRLQERVNSQEI